MNDSDVVVRDSGSPLATCCRTAYITSNVPTFCFRPANVVMSSEPCTGSLAEICRIHNSSIPALLRQFRPFRSSLLGPFLRLPSTALALVISTRNSDRYGPSFLSASPTALAILCTALVPLISHTYRRLPSHENRSLSCMLHAILLTGVLNMWITS